MTAKGARPPDHEVRLRAATDFDHNLVVVAGAGTGKTSLLVERILTALGLGRVRIGDLAAITFTEKAAGELRQRVAAGLERLRAVALGEARPDPREAADRAGEHLARRFGVPAREIAARSLAGLQGLDRARVETIHTFCAALLREHPLEAGVQPDFQIDAGEVYQALLDESWERFVIRELGAAAERADVWERVIDRLSLDDVREAAVAMASFSVPETLLRATAAPPEAHAVGEFAADERLLADLQKVAVPFALEAREELLRRGHVTFDALLLLARNLLRDHPGVREALKRRFRMLLIDEFQDTDPVQYEIVLYLAEREGASTSDAHAAELAPGRLFVVGDPKQSIYRFRGADYGAFRRAVARVEECGGARLSLTANFRSVPTILEPVNALFDESTTRCWHPSIHQPRYEPIREVREAAADGPRVEVWTVRSRPGMLASDRREAEGKIVAGAIRRMVASGATGYGRITVLLRAFTHLPDYLRPMRELDIPFVVDGGREFLARPEVAQLLGAVKALARPADPAAVVAFLRSPLGAVPDPQLAAYATAGKRWSWWEEVDAGAFPEVARAFRILRGLSEATRDSPPDETIRRALRDTGLLTLSAAAFEGPQRVANLVKLAASAGELARDGRLSVLQVVEALEQGRTTNAESDSPLADDDTDAVRVMTIHKAKGLENDVVILPDLAREDRARSPGGTARVLRLEDGRQSLALEVAGVSNAAWREFEREESRHREAEEVRVLYVGATRARERLILLAAPSRRRASWIEALASWGYEVGSPPADGAVLVSGCVLHRAVAPEAAPRAARPAVAAAASAAVEAHDATLRRLRLAARPGIEAPSDEERWREVGPRAAPPARGLGDDARAVGIATHRLLEGWDRRHDELLLGRIASVCAAAADEAGATAASVEREVREIVSGFLASELRRRLESVEILGRELPILELADDGTIYRGTLDLLYRDRDGRVVVADYKTDRETDPARLRAVYGPQMEIYARAVRQALGLLWPPSTELWVLRAATRFSV